MEISKDTCDQILNLFENDQNKAIDEMMELLNTFINLYTDIDDEKLKTNPLFLQHIELVYTFIHDFYTHKDVMDEIEKEKNNITDESEIQEMNDYLDFVSKLKIVKASFENGSIFNINTSFNYNQLIKEINSYIMKKKQDINDLNNTMSELSNRLTQLHDALILNDVIKTGPNEEVSTSNFTHEPSEEKSFIDSSCNVFIRKDDEYFRKQDEYLREEEENQYNIIEEFIDKHNNLNQLHASISGHKYYWAREQINYFFSNKDCRCINYGTSSGDMRSHMLFRHSNGKIYVVHNAYGEFSDYFPLTCGEIIRYFEDEYSSINEMNSDTKLYIKENYDFNESLQESENLNYI